MGKRKENISVKFLSPTVQNLHRCQADLSVSHHSISWAGSERQVVLSVHVYSQTVFILKVVAMVAPGQKPTKPVTASGTKQVTKTPKYRGTAKTVCVHKKCLIYNSSGRPYEHPYLGSIYNLTIPGYNTQTETMDE